MGSATIQEVRAAIASGKATATAIAEEHYARIATEDGPSGKGINSFLALSRDRALEQAAKIDAMAAKGDALPPLAGVPVGIKDVLTMKGSPATAGSLILKGYMPPYDATAVTRMEAAGAVLLGKLNCDEFAMGSSNENSAYGPVHNPRALDRVARRQQWRPTWPWQRWAPTPADRFANRRPSVAWSACCRHMGASRATG